MDDSTNTGNTEFQKNCLAQLSNGEAVTTSIAIADGTTNQHKNVLELIVRYKNDLEEFGRVTFETQSFATRGGDQKREVAILNEQQATLILTYMRNNEIVRTFKKRLVKAFYELTKQGASVTDIHTALSDPNKLRGMLLEYTEKVIALENTVKAQQPKVEFHDNVAQAINSQTVQEVAKVLGTGPNRLFKALRERGLLMDNNLPYQAQIDSGRFKVVEKQYRDKRGEMQTYTQTLITGKGLIYIQRNLTH